MIDVFYVLGSGSKWQNNEIRYSLRTLEKYGHNVGQVYIVGQRPSFIPNQASSWLLSCCMRELRATIARLFALVMASISPVNPNESGVSGTTWARPPPAAEPLMLKVGPPLGCRTVPITRLPSFPNPSTNPSVVVVFPSPSGVGVIAVTSI